MSIDVSCKPNFPSGIDAPSCCFACHEVISDKFLIKVGGAGGSDGDRNENARGMKQGGGDFGRRRDERIGDDGYFDAPGMYGGYGLGSGSGGGGFSCLVGAGFDESTAAWHEDCMKCVVCRDKLEHICYLRDGKIYCREDYLRWVRGREFVAFIQALLTDSQTIDPALNLSGKMFINIAVYSILHDLASACVVAE